jgi:deazaflavin-dependent oxidoreductase (nitroreductase family)
MTESKLSSTGSSSTGSSGNAATSADDFNAKIVGEYRANGGKLGGMFTGSDLLLLHHTGAKTGARRVTPLAYQRIGDSFAVFASRAGSTANPDWYHNVVAHPDVLIEIGTETVAVRARLAEPAERDVIWERQKKRVPQFAEYEKKAAPRKIPVVVLDPVK